MMNEMEVESKKKVLEDLMQSMDDREVKNKMGKLLTIKVGVGEDGTPQIVEEESPMREGKEEDGEDMSGDGMGMDPRVAELIRKKEEMY
jgi:hypothetical protein